MHKLDFFFSSRKDKYALICEFLQHCFSRCCIHVKICFFFAFYLGAFNLEEYLTLLCNHIKLLCWANLHVAKYGD